MQGLFIDGRRPKSKKQVKEADPSTIEVEATSMFGNEFGGPATDAPVGQSIYFVGPDPYTKRNFYGTLINRGNGRVVVK